MSRVKHAERKKKEEDPKVNMQSISSKWWNNYWIWRLSRKLWHSINVVKRDQSGCRRRKVKRRDWCSIIVLLRKTQLRISGNFFSIWKNENGHDWFYFRGTFWCSGSGPEQKPILPNMLRWLRQFLTTQTKKWVNCNRIWSNSCPTFTKFDFVTLFVGCEVIW